MKEGDGAKEPLESELMAMSQRIAELETMLEENARLYAQAQQEITERKRIRERLLAAERAQARRQAALLRLSAELAATLEEAEVCRRVVDGLHDTLRYDFVALFLVDETTGDRVLAASVGFDEPPTRLRPGEGLSERPLLDGQLQYTPDVTQDSRYFYGIGGSEVDAPVRIGEEVLGVLIAESKQHHAFNQDDFEVLTAAAQQTGLAIEKARLLAVERQRADELDALYTTMADITAELELPALLQAIVERATGLLDATGGELGLYDKDSRDIRIVVSHNMGKDYVGTRVALGEGAMGSVAASGEPLILEDYRTWEGRASQYADLRMHAGLAAPFEVGGRLVGVINIGTADPARQFGPTDLHLLNLFAQQAAIAIENARLFAETERRVAELATLTDIGQALSSTLRVDEVVQLIYEQTRRVMYAENMLIMLYDQARHETECALSTRKDELAPGTRWPADTGLTGYIIKHRQSVLLRGDVIEDVIERARDLGGVILEPAASYLGVPMLTGERVLGVITVWHYTAPNVYDESHQVLLETVASQAAIAIENARLYADLRASQEYARNIIDSSLDPIVAVDKERRVVEFNKAAQETFGYRPEEILGRRADVLYADVQEGLDVHRTTIEQGRCIQEVMNRRKNGKVFPVFLSASLLRDARGELVGVMGVSRDITERKRAEAELRKYQEHLEELVEERTADLRESEERYRTLFDGVPVGLYRSTPAGQMVDANLAFVQMLGYPSQEDLQAINSANLYVDPEDRVRWQALMEREGVVRDFETQQYRYDGTVIWVNETARAVRDEQGQVLYYEGSLEDISERKRAEAELRRYQEHLKELVEERTAELRESEERYRTLFDGVPVGLYRTTPEGQILDVNRAFVQMSGCPDRETLLGLNAASFYVDPEDRVRWRALMEREGVVRDFEVQHRVYDGTIVWNSDTARAVMDEQGQVLYYEGSLENITERKELEEEIRRQKDYFEALFVNNPVAVVTVDMDAYVVAWNPAAERLFGYTQAEAIGRNVDDLVASDDSVRAEAVGYTDRVLDLELERVQATTKRTRKDGSLVDVEVLGLPVIVAGEKVGFIAIYRDITERKEFEDEIRRRKEYFEALFVNSPVAVVTVDLDATVVAWNPVAEKLFEYTQEEAIGKNLDDLVANDPRVREEALRYSNQVFTMGRVQATTKRTRKDGSFVDVEVLALPVVVAGELVGYIAIYYDISELQEARREAEAANQAKSAFLANMSHELRTPLNAILGFTQLMDRDSNLTTEQQENLGIINRSGEHLLVLINDVLEMSKIEAGRVTLEETSFDLYRLLEGLEEMFGLRAKDKGLVLSFERAENVPQYVRADEGKLRQILSNLLGNAVKFTQEGGVALRVTALSHSQERETLHFEVEDTGPGIAPEELEAVFNPFVQAARGQQPQEGTGLGLSISQQYVRLMGGDITVKSSSQSSPPGGRKGGQGSLFKFDVQVGLVDAAEIQVAQPTRRVLGLEPNQRAADGGPYRLLVAEDKETNRQLLVRLLTGLGLPPMGFEVKEAANGQKALEIWERWEPHLIWMDMRMPVVDGYEATRRIKATTKGQATVIIALTASAFEEDRERVLAEGCDDFVRKPFRENEIYDMLAKHLRVRFVYDEEQAQLAMAHPVATASLAAALAALPAGWMADLQQATIRADLNLILTLIEQIHGQNPALADTLVDWAHNFEYKKILTLIEQSGR